VASSNVVVGGPVHDTAFIVGGSAHTGQITFRLFGPNNPNCAAPPIFTASQTVNAGTRVYQSADFQPRHAATYLWVAAYSGDANNQPAHTTCGPARETVVVVKRSPRLTTTASPVLQPTPVRRSRTAAGVSIRDTALLSNAVAPTGRISFILYGPGDATCSGTPIFRTATVVNGNGRYNSQAFTPTVSGVYRWRARYGGDADNHSAGLTRCGDPLETVQVTVPSDPDLVTSSSQSVDVGGAVQDTAFLSGGSNPRGTITFRLYGPLDTNCSRPPVFTSTVDVNGNGSYQSASFSPSATGGYRWVAHYSGDPVNHPTAATICGAMAETVIVQSPFNPAVVGLSTTASASDGIGAPITDTARLTGELHPTGAITYQLFGPANPTCSGHPVFTTTTDVNGNGAYTSAPFTVQKQGTYSWVVSYNGDAVNAGVGPGACGAPGEKVTVSSRIEPDVNPGPEPAPIVHPASKAKPKPKPKPKPPKPPRPTVTG
jgi:hypothetical protein